MASILIIEDELVLLHQLGVALTSGGFEVETAGNASIGLEKARESRPDLVLLDLRLPDRSGLELIEELKAIDPSMLVVMMTAYGSVRDAVEAMRRGAADFLNKPIDVGELGLRIDRLLREQRRSRELSYLRERDRSDEPAVLGRSLELRQLLSQVERLCDAHVSPGRRPPVLLFGEAGTGKRRIARQIHERLGSGPLIDVSCAALAPERLERELFGLERGVDPDPETSETGLFEAAEGGTLVLDEISDLGDRIQEQLLRVLIERRIRRVGSERDREVDVQVIATTRTEDPHELISTGRLRADLLDRLRGLSFRIPPLRERLDDIDVLAQHLASELGYRFRGAPRTLEPKAIDALRDYDWPGNLRELSNVLERAVLLHRDESLSAEMLAPLVGAASHWATPGRVLLPEEGVSLEEVEKDLLRQALARTKGNRTRAGALVGLSRDTLRYRIAKLGLDVEPVPRDA